MASRQQGQRSQKKTKGHRKCVRDLSDLQTFAGLSLGLERSEEAVLNIILDHMKNMVIKEIHRQEHKDTAETWTKQTQHQHNVLTTVCDKYFTQTKSPEGTQMGQQSSYVDNIFHKAYILRLETCLKMLSKEIVNIISDYSAIQECFKVLGDKYLLVKFDIELLLGKAYLMQKKWIDGKEQEDLKQNIIRSKGLYDKCRAKIDSLAACDVETSPFYAKYIQIIRENWKAKPTDTNKDLLNLMHIELIRNYHGYYKLIDHSTKTLHYGIMALKHDLYYNRFDIKEWIDNAVALSFYAASDVYAFAQSYYLLRVATMFLEREEKNVEMKDEMENPILKLRELRERVAKGYVEHFFYIHYFMELHATELKGIPECASEEFINENLIKPCGILTKVVEFENLPGEVPHRDPDLERIPIKNKAKEKFYSVMEDYKKEVAGLQNKPRTEMLQLKCGCCISQN